MAQMIAVGLLKEGVMITNDSPLILIAEDTPDVLMVLIELLELEGYRVHSASDGQAAWDYLQACHHLPDLLITDHMMPRMTGIDLCAKVRDDDKTRNVPVMIYSASAHFKSEASKLACSFISKPFDIDAMLAQVQTILKEKKYEA